MPATTNILAAMVTPALLWGGLGAMSAPIIIHLLSRRRFRRMPWAATMFLLEAKRRNRRRIRAEQLVLLALRCLIMALLGLVVARPFVQPGAWTAALGMGQRTEHILVLDDSFSMGAKLEGGSVFDRARAMLVGTLDLLHNQSPGDPVTVMVTSRPWAPLVAGVYLDSVGLAELGREIDGLEVSETASIGEAFAELARTWSESPAAPNAVVYVISDFRAKDWAISSAAGREAKPAPLDPLVGIEREPGSLSLVMLDAGPADTPNLAVTEVRSAQPRLVAGVGGMIEISITNFSNAEAKDVPVRVFVDDAALSYSPAVTIGPGDTVLLPVTLPAQEAGSHRVLVELETDALEADNVRRLAARHAETLRVLILDGEPATNSLRDEAALLATALRPAGPVPSGNDVRVVDEVEFAETELGEYDLVILANVYRPDAESFERLEQYAASGGGVVFFLGDQVEPALYNELYHRQGRGLFPVRLEEVVRVPAGRAGVSLVVDDPVHPLTAVFSGGGEAFLQRVGFRGYVRVADEPSTALHGDANTDAAGDPGDETFGAENDVRVLLRFNDESASPALIERNFGAGRVLVFTSSCDTEWNNWALSPSYVVTALELAGYAARPAREPGQVLVGESISFALDPGRFEPAADLKMPGAEQAPPVGIRAQPAEGRDTLRVRWNQTERSGVYAFQLTARNGPRRDMFVAVNVDPAESDLTACGREELAEVCRTVTENFSFQRAPADLGEWLAGPREVWPAVLVGLVMLLMCEQALAWWFGTRS